MKVLFLTNIPSPYRVDFFNELGKRCELTVLFEAKSAKSRDASWMVDKITDFKAVFMKGIRIGEAESLCLEVVKYLSKKKYNHIVVGIYSSPTGMLAIEYMKLLNIPFILSSDGGMKKEDRGFKHWVKQHFIGAADAWLSTGKTTTEYLTHYGAVADKVYWYPFTSVRKADILEHPVPEQKKKELRQKLNMPESKIVLSVGQFIYRKGYDVLLNNCHGMNKGIGLYIVGGKATEEYIDLQKKYDLTNVHFVDFMKKDKLAEYYQAADLFILPTREDIWGLVVNEAMANGLPVITTDKCVAGIEMVHDGINGKIVPVETDWREVIESFLSIETLLEISQNSLLTSTEYSVENMADVHYKVFSRIAREK